MISIENRSLEKRALRGKKRTCKEEECGKRFYDLNKDPIICPVCTTIFIPEPEVVVLPKGHKRKPIYKLEVPEPKVEKKSKLDQDGTGTNVTDETDEQVLGPGDLQILLDNDDDSKAVVETEISKDKQSTSDDP